MCPLRALLLLQSYKRAIHILNLYFNSLTTNIQLHLMNGDKTGGLTVASADLYNSRLAVS